MVDIKDRDGFALKLKELIENEEIQKKLSHENRKRVEKYSTENVAKMYIKEIFND
jgi:glycosyltransferase involved in cell wall biosynthesis